MADLHGYPIFERLPALSDFVGIDLLPADKFPRLTAWVSAMQQLDFVKKLWMSKKMHHQFLVGYKSGSLDYDMEMDDETSAVQNGAT